MYLKNILFLLVLIFIQFSNSQIPKEGVVYERNDDKSIDFRYTKSTLGSIYVILKFRNLDNASSDVVKQTISGYGGSLVTLQPSNPSEGISFSYSYRIVPGDVDAKPDFDFKYILPFKKNKDIKVRNLNYLGKRFGNTEPKNWRSFQFLTQPNDTVCAIRKGLVISITNGINTDKSKTNEYGYRNKANSITIEHEDGTIAKYEVLKKDSFMVALGDTVYPSAPLAIAGSYDKAENSQLRLSIYFLDKLVKDLDFDEKSKERLGNQTHLYAFVDPLFYVNENEALKLEPNKTYSAVCGVTIIEQEMSKREKKRWKKNRELVKK